MGLYDRDYVSQNYSRPQMGFSLPRIRSVVKWLLILNFAMFAVQIIARRAGFSIENLLAVEPTSYIKILQVWRLIGYQFLHGSIGHIFFNMLALFFLGPTLEGHWGSNRFLKFYLICGAAGGIFYTILALIGWLPKGQMVGASGAILGLLAACAILFPRFVVFIFLFPVPIRVAATIFAILYVLNILQAGHNAGGDAAHLAGMATGAVYVLWPRMKNIFRLKSGSNKWEKKLQRQRDLQIEVDRILEKVHQSGIKSLTRKERKTLEEATKLEQMRNR